MVRKGEFEGGGKGEAGMAEGRESEMVNLWTKK